MSKVRILVSVAAFSLTLGSTSTWGQNQLTELGASDGGMDDNFGRVAVDGDTLVVGAQHADLQGVDAGAAYVFVYDGSTWSEQAKLVPTMATAPLMAGDWYGTQVAIDGDTVVVSAPRDEEVANMNCNAGGVWVFTRTGTVWTEEDYLVPDVPACFTQVGPAAFGSAIDIEGDTIVIGAPSDDTSLTVPCSSGAAQDCNSGSAFVFERSGSVWSQVAKLTADDLTSSDNFGNAVAIQGDLIVIGAPDNESLSGSGSGAVYLFEKPMSGWATTGTFLQKLEASDKEDRDEFGRGLAIDDGLIAIGAAYDDDGGVDTGSAYVFEDNGATWTEVAKLTASHPTDGSRFGSSVSVSDGLVVVGAGADSSTSPQYEGAAYVFKPPFTGPATEDRKLVNDPQVGPASDSFGLTVAVSGDVLAIGNSRGDPGGVSNAGAAYTVSVSSLTAAFTFRNGLGGNPPDFWCRTAPAIGAKWVSSIELTPTSGSSTILTIVDISFGGPTSGIVLPPGGVIVGEILGLPSYKFFFGAGLHSITIPLDTGLIGVPVFAKGSRFEDISGAAVLVLLNAQDLVLGF